MRERDQVESATPGHGPPERAQHGLVLQVQAGIDEDRPRAAQQDAVGEGRHADDLARRFSSRRAANASGERCSGTTSTAPVVDAKTKRAVGMSRSSVYTVGYAGASAAGGSSPLGASVGLMAPAPGPVLVRERRRCRRGQVEDR